MAFTDTYPNPSSPNMFELEMRYATMDSLQDRFEEIYGPRDRIYLDERFKRIRLFETGVADHLDALRRDPTPESLKLSLARVTSRIFSIANSIDGVRVSDGMMMKFPKEGCAYCGSQPCVCMADRGEPSLGGYNAEQASWGLRDWQKHLENLYGKPNREKGIWFAAVRLAVETNELVAEEDKVPVSSPEDIRKNYALETADAMAWHAAGATILRSDLQTGALERYGNGCPTCKAVPCQCSRHNFQQVKFD
jgi:hypothetical protein